MPVTDTTELTLAAAWAPLGVLSVAGSWVVHPARHAKSCSTSHQHSSTAYADAEQWQRQRRVAPQHSSSYDPIYREQHKEFLTQQSHPVHTHRQPAESARS